MENVRVVLVTIPAGKAEELASNVVENRLAACVNVVPTVKSFFWWDDKLQNTDEAMLVIKTTQIRLEELIKFVRNNHPYDVPEIITIPVAEGLPDYINWVIEETGKVRS